MRPMSTLRKEICYVSARKAKHKKRHNEFTTLQILVLKSATTIDYEMPNDDVINGIAKQFKMRKIKIRNFYSRNRTPMVKRRVFDTIVQPRSENGRFCRATTIAENLYSVVSCPNSQVAQLLDNMNMFFKSRKLVEKKGISYPGEANNNKLFYFDLTMSKVPMYFQQAALRGVQPKNMQSFWKTFHDIARDFVVRSADVAAVARFDKQYTAVNSDRMFAPKRFFINQYGAGLKHGVSKHVDADALFLTLVINIGEDEEGTEGCLRLWPSGHFDVEPLLVPLLKYQCVVFAQGVIHEVPEIPRENVRRSLNIFY